MFKKHQGADCMETVVTENDNFGSSLTVSASTKDGKTLVTIGNLSCEEDAVFTLESVGMELPAEAKARLLAHEDMHAHNTFEDPNAVQVQDLSLNPRKPITIPKAGILAIEF